MPAYEHPVDDVGQARIQIPSVIVVRAGNIFRGMRQKMPYSDAPLALQVNTARDMCRKEFLNLR